jgi:hypothetical protein
MGPLFVSVRSRIRSHLLAVQLQRQVSKCFFMPSFVYVARIARLSEEQAEGLRSAGFHVKSFGPGEITADDCFMVMTSEALLAKPFRTSSGPAAESAAMPDAKSPDKPAVPAMPVPSVNEELGSQAAIWHIIKTAAANESAARTAANCGPASPVASVTDQEAENLGLIPTAVGQRAFSALRPTQGENSGPLPRLKNAPFANAGRSSPSPPFTHRPGQDRRTRTAVGRSHRPWQPMATVAALLILAGVLLTHRASTLNEAASQSTNESRRTDSDSSRSTQTIQPSSLTLSFTESSRPSAGVRRHVSDYDFVAEDFTNHFDAHAHNRATLQTPDLKHNAPGSTERKRIVNN